MKKDYKYFTSMQNLLETFFNFFYTTQTNNKYILSLIGYIIYVINVTNKTNIILVLNE